MPATIPNCFLVGAPKSASTSLARFLRERPGGFVPTKKELCWLAPDVYVENKLMTRAEYLAFFAEAPEEAVCVAEASPMYLYSSEAPRQIAALNADARIVIVLRDPVQLVRSMHRQNVESRIEPFFELESALGAESLRTAGIPVPRHQKHTTHAFLRYTAIGSYAPQLQRYFAVFPRQQIHVMIFERLLSAQQEELSRLLAFLGLGVDGELRLPLENPTVAIRNSFATRLVAQPPASARRFARLLPRSLRGKVAHWVWRSHVQTDISQALPTRLEAYLRNFFAADTRAVENLLGLELPEWRSSASL
jgi:hypothetical protein